MPKVYFHGGPRNGKSKDYQRNPRQVGCVTEAKEQGFAKGLYLQRKSEDRDGPEVNLVWVEVRERAGQKPELIWPKEH